MSDLRVLVASDLPQFVRDDIQSAFRMSFSLDADIDARLQAAKGADAIILSVDVRLTEDRILRLPKSVRAIGTYSVGLDHIDLRAVAQRGLVVFNTPGVLADAVAEVALFLTLGAARRGTESINLIRGGGWPGWTPTQLIGHGLSGRTMGIFGMGAIGRRVASRARAFGMEIAYHDPIRQEDEEAKGSRWFSTPDDLLSSCDVLVLACPSTEQTRGFICKRRLDKVRDGFMLVNIGRGDLVVDEDLVAALQQGRVAGAGLDVFAGEPHFDKRYLEIPTAFLTPHIGSSTVEARRGMGRIIIEALCAWENGQVPVNQVRL